MYNVPRLPWTATPLMRAALICLTIALLGPGMQLIDSLDDWLEYGRLASGGLNGPQPLLIGVSIAYMLVYGWTLWRPRWWRVGLLVLLLAVFLANQ